MILLAPAAFTASVLRAQNTVRTASNQSASNHLESEDEKQPADTRLPNGKNQTDEILKDDYEKNLKDARDLTGLARGLEEDLEKNEAFVFSLASLKKLDDMERLTKRIRSRMKRY
jgi:ribosome-binding protein aMBF1 (putative translation factor)